MIDESNKEHRIKQELKLSKFSNSISLPFERLFCVPPAIASIDWVTNIRRLDLSNNCISVVPDFITKLSQLKELWLQGNPISSFPAKIESMGHLEMIDIRNTKISAMPAELCLVKTLCFMDWRDTPAAEFYYKRYDVAANDLRGLISVLNNTHRRIGLERQLFLILSEEHFAKEADQPGIKDFIVGLVEVNFY
jgi:Leucine-rich repeat (LRR) protein